MKATRLLLSLIGFLLLAVAHLPAQSVQDYAFTTSTGATLNSMTGATTLTFASNDDAVTNPMPIGFDFVFEGILYSEYSVATDGFIRLGPQNALIDYTNDLTENTNLPKVTPLWDDHHFGNTNTGSVKTLLTGTAPNRIRVIQWFVTIPRNISGTANGTFQLWLYETTNVIEFRYGTAGDPGSASVGLSGASTSPVQFLSVTTSDHTVSGSSANNSNTVWPGSGRRYTFTPPQSSCDMTFSSSDVPVWISPTQGGLVSSTLNVPVFGTVTDVNLHLNLPHDYVGDLQAWLVSPENDTVKLFDQPGAPTTQFGCSGDNIIATFDDEAVAPHSSFENMCNTATPPAISGNFKPWSSLSAFDGEIAQGTWTLLVNDTYGTEDGGLISSWSLEFCLDIHPLPNLALSAPLTVSQSGTNVSVNFTVVNNGTAQADETWARIYILNTATGQPVVTLASRKIPPLTIGQTQNVSFSLDICSARLQPNQPYRVAYALDFSNALHESNEADNMGTVANVPITIGPDSALPAPSGTGGNATADNLINQFLQTWRVPGAAVAVARQGKMFYEKGFGHADCAQAPVLPTTRFRAPGISNTLTAAAIHKLIQDGQITLNSKVFGTGGILWANSYFAGTPLADPRMADITVRHLLEHTSLWEDEGLCFPTPNQYPLPGGLFLGFSCDPYTYPLTVAAFLNESNPASRRAIIKYALQNIPLSGPPGSAHDFSNINYATLAQIIEVKTGQNYANWVKNNILAPAGVCDMEIGGARLSNKLPREAEYFSPNTQLSASGSGFDYVQYGGFWLPSMDAHSGWVGTAAEWLRFLLSIDGLPTKPDPVLTMSSVSAMSQPSPNNPAFGRGWQLDGQGNWFFTGQIAGSAAHFMRKPDGTALVILLNSSEGFSPDDLKNLMQNCANALPGGTPAIDLLAGTVPSGPISVNGGFTYTYSVAPVNGATSYTWTPPPGVSINGNLAGQAVTLSAAQGTSVSVTFIQGSGSCVTKTLCVKANNRCAEGCLTIIIN